MKWILPRLKFICKRDFVVVKHKYEIKNKLHQKTIDEAQDLDVLILQTLPSSKLQVLDVKILNELTFDRILRTGKLKEETK